MSSAFFNPAEHFPPKEVRPLADASASGDLDTIKQILDSYLANQPPGDYELHEFWPVLLTALAYGHPEITSYLLDMGIPLSRVHVQRAHRNKISCHLRRPPLPRMED